MWRVVLDTNVVLDLLHFDEASVWPIRQALEEERARCYASTHTLGELQRVLMYPEFALTPSTQAALLARYRTWLHEAPDTHAQPYKLPRCRDPDDQMFLELAAGADADLLISKDKALLAMQRVISRFKIVTPTQAAVLLT